MTVELTNEEQVVAQLCAVLKDATGGQVDGRVLQRGKRINHKPDAVLNLTVAEQTAEIAVEVLRNGYPRDIREAVWQLEEYCSSVTSKPMALVAAESLSPGAKDQLRRQGIGFFERNGSLYLKWQQWLIDIERPEKARPTKRAPSLFTSAREKVVHALLTHRSEPLTGGELAKLADTSTFTCSKVLQELERREWCESNGTGRNQRRQLVEPGKLLDTWADAWVNRKEQRSRWYVFADSPGGLLMHITYQIDQAKISTPWAFTGTAAANVYAPLLTTVDTAEIIVPKGHAELLADTLELRPAEKGANITFVEREGTSLQFRRKHPDYPSYFASPFILYLDLLDGRGRNKELAEHVREKLEV